ncbi:hypothetical protein SAMN06297387_12870 [Streptomyces zhaozhouensis]|uniref:Uncharacterized protein n=1 Tax=Streptomyces zhaozhouensis TaxID=1300267 RepID=A0A286E896_9ACTN|nr:hypothetical protein [Streptomyces zhaozhouensis]SOD67110.1 hypothetical protein SAMN06297387_12870 [Streptomyces zhaozhouensis]
MEELAREYNGAVVVVVSGGAEVPGQAELQVWHGTPTGVTEHGEMVVDLDPALSRWGGTVTVSPGPDAPPMPLPTDGLLTLRLSDGRQARAEVEAVEWTLDEALVLAVIGQETAPF